MKDGNLHFERGGIMDYQKYESYNFYYSHAINVATGYEGRSYPNHWHTYGEIIRVGEGETNIYRVNQTNYSLDEGDFVFVWPMEQHEIVDADREKAIVIQFTSAFCKSLFDFERIMHFFHDMHVIQGKDHPEIAAKLSEITIEMRDIFYSRERNRESRCCILLLKIINLLDEYRDEIKSKKANDKNGNLSAETIKRIIEITDHVKSNLSSDDLSESFMAEKAGISKEHFSRAFKEVTGENYSKWLNMIRVDEAISMFPIESLSLTDIAMRAGFQSIPSFNRVFRNLKGISPGQYRTMNS